VIALPAHKTGGTNNKAAARAVNAGFEALGEVSYISARLYPSP